MRIIAGQYKGRKLFFPRTPDVRPAMDKVRESIFNVLGEVVQNAEVLDLFAGSGSLGFEALSRGARHVTFVDTNREALRSIKKNAELLSCQGQVTLLAKSVETALSVIKKSGNTSTQFDLIFIDPPYDKGFLRKTLSQVIEFDILRPFGWLIMEHSKSESGQEIGEYKKVKVSKFGATHLTFLFRRS